MIDAFFLSLGQLGDRRVLAVLVKSLAVTLVLFAVFGVAVWFGTEAAIDAVLGWRSGALAAALALFVTVLALWLLFRAVAIAVVGVFADEVVAAVEAKHYPAALKGARAVPLARSVAMGAASATRFALVNLALLPFYILLLATGVGTAALFFVANGWLLGRDLGDMVAVRHLAPEAVRGWRGANRGGRFVLGLVGTGLFVVPVLNLFAPVIGAAMATHLFHRGRT